jgi:transcriptional regulator with XRE-family HTH domain
MKILKDLRDRSGLTLRQVEEATGISNAYLSQLENGKIKHPSAQSLYTLSKLYSTNIEDLLIAAGMIKDDERVIPVQLKESVEQRLNKLEKKVDEIWAKNIIFGSM